MHNYSTPEYFEKCFFAAKQAILKDKAWQFQPAFHTCFSFKNNK